MIHFSCEILGNPWEIHAKSLCKKDHAYHIIYSYGPFSKALLHQWRVNMMGMLIQPHLSYELVAHNFVMFVGFVTPSSYLDISTKNIQKS